MRKHCCGHIVADTNVSPFACARNICCGHENASDFVQKHFVSTTNVSQFAQHGDTTFILFPECLRAQETSLATMCPQQCVFVCHGLKKHECENDCKILKINVVPDFCPV